MADALRESEEKYRSIVDNIGIGISLIGPDMEILSLNRHMQQWFPHIEAAKKPVCYRAFNTPPKDEVCSYCPTCKTLRDGQVHISVTETPVNGEIRNYRIISSPVGDKEGTIIAAIEMVEDVTERKRSEEEIIRLNEALRNNILQLENTNKELESFSYSVSHDLRAPLRAIDGFSRILLEDYGDKYDAEGKRLLNIIRTNTQRMGELIDDLLALSRLGRKEIGVSDIDMDKLVKGLFDELGLDTDKQKLQVNLKPLPPACGDIGMIRQVFANLLLNAVKFTKPRETAVIEIGGYNEDSHAAGRPLVHRLRPRPADLQNG